MNRQFGTASVVMQLLYWTTVVKKELKNKVRVFFYQSVYVPTLTHGPELWIVTKGQSYRYKWQKLGFSGKSLGLALDIGPDISLSALGGYILQYPTERK